MIDILDLMTDYYTASIENLDSKYYALSLISKNYNHESQMNTSTQQLKQLKENVNRIYHMLQKHNI